MKRHRTRCPACRGTTVIKHGTTARGVQRYRCLQSECPTVSFVLQRATNPYTTRVEYWWRAYRTGYRVYNPRKVYHRSQRDDWGTPPALFAALDAEFHFTLDVCATPDNATCPRYFTPADDGLAQSWAGEVCCMNPPYGRGIDAWVRKAYESAQEGATVVYLVKATPDTRWWHAYRGMFGMRVTLQRHLIHFFAIPVFGGGVLRHLSSPLMLSNRRWTSIPCLLGRWLPPSRAPSEAEATGCSGHGTFAGEFEGMKSIFYYKN